jgi:para-nitrobenzyl esterase
MQRIYINFVTHGSPNGTGVPEWQALDVDQVGRFMRIGVDSAMEYDVHQVRYRFLDDLLDGGMRGV